MRFRVLAETLFRADRSVILALSRAVLCSLAPVLKRGVAATQLLSSANPKKKEKGESHFTNRISVKKKRTGLSQFCSFLHDLLDVASILRREFRQGHRPNFVRQLAYLEDNRNNLKFFSER